MIGYRKQFIKSIGWVGLLKLIIRGMTFLRLAILARILSPFQFGLVGIATLVLSLLEIFTETGINVFLIQEKKEIKEYINTAWVVSIVRGTTIAAVIFFSASTVASFFNSKDSFGLILLISLVPLIRGFINPAVVTFQKELKFQKEFLYQLSLFLVDTVVVLSFAYFTKSASSLIYGMLASALFEVIVSFFLVKPTPKFGLSKENLIKIINNGKWVSAAGIFNYLYQNLDNIVVGKIIGVQALGIYNIGYKLSSVPITEISDVSSRVTFPLYVKIAGEKARLKSAYINIVLLIGLFSSLFGILLFFFTKEIVLIILGEKWIASVPLIKILVVCGVLRGISGSSSALFLAVKKQKYVTLITLISLVGLLITIIPFVIRYGLIGAAYSAVVGSILPLPFILYFLVKVFKKNYDKY